MQDLLIRGGHVIDPAQGLNGRHDLVVHHGKIAAILDPGQDAPSAARVVDVAGQYVVPGLIDFHVHEFQRFE